MTSLKVTFIGTGDAFGSGGRLQTCILADGPAIRFAIDFGTTSLVGLRKHDIDPNSLDLIILTHLHGDHCGGIPFLLLDAMLGSKRTEPLTIVGPSGTKSHLQSLQNALFPGSGVMVPKFELQYVEVSPNSETEVAGLSIRAVEARHTRETNPLALRVQLGDLAIAYTGDGELTDQLVYLTAGVDLLIAESYFYDKSVRWHLNYPDIQQFDAKRIILTHMHTNMLDHVNTVPEECAYDGYSITI